MKLLRFAPALMLVATAPAAQAVDLRPHRAVYDLKLASQSESLIDVKGRIALQLEADGCEAYDLDYRFVARFHREDDVTVTDQQTLSRETRTGDGFEFETKTLVDGIEQGVIKGKAANRSQATNVSFLQPVSRTLDLPLSNFPLHHTSELIAKAQAGERIVESRLFDGDDEADKLLTTTALITPVDKPDAKPNEKVATGSPDLKSWMITESYYNSDSDDDGMPIFQTRYRLYENGVSDDIYMDFGEYALEGRLGQLDYLGEAACAEGR